MEIIKCEVQPNWTTSLGMKNINNWRHVISVVTEISSATLHANGYKNTTMPTKISSPATLKCIQKAKNTQLHKTLTCTNSPKKAHA